MNQKVPAAPIQLLPMASGLMISVTKEHLPRQNISATSQLFQSLELKKTQPISGNELQSLCVTWVEKEAQQKLLPAHCGGGGGEFDMVT